MNNDIIFDGISYGLNGEFYYEYRRAGKYYSKPIEKFKCDNGATAYYCKISNKERHYLTKEEIAKFASLVKAVGAKI